MYGSSAARRKRIVRRRPRRGPRPRRDHLRQRRKQTDVTTTAHTRPQGSSTGEHSPCKCHLLQEQVPPRATRSPDDTGRDATAARPFGERAAADDTGGNDEGTSTGAAPQMTSSSGPAADRRGPRAGCAYLPTCLVATPAAPGLAGAASRWRDLGLGRGTWLSGVVWAPRGPYGRRRAAGVAVPRTRGWLADDRGARRPVHGVVGDGRTAAVGHRAPGGGGLPRGCCSRWARGVRAAGPSS